MKLKKSDVVLIAGVILILFSLLLLSSEIKPAKSFCNSINQTYSFLPALKHECNEIQIYKYNSKVFGKYWGFSSMEAHKIIIPKEWNKVSTKP